MMLTKEFRFEASHQLHNHPGKCAKLHGHSWVLLVRVSGPVQRETAMVLDFDLLKKAVQPVIDRLDHTHLGSGVVGNLRGSLPTWMGPSHEATLPLLPTSEALLVWIAEQLPTDFPWSELTLSETCTSAASLTREEFEELRDGKGLSL